MRAVIWIVGDEDDELEAVSSGGTGLDKELTEISGCVVPDWEGRGLESYERRERERKRERGK